MDPRGELTVRQAGQRGGSSTADKHGSSFYREIGKRGGQARKGQLGTEGYAKLGRKGGEARGRKQGRGNGSAARDNGSTTDSNGNQFNIDGGVIELSTDDGKSWQNVTPKGIPEWIRINSLDVSRTDKGNCYVAATMYQFDDFRPYLYKTADYGKTWTKIVDGIPDGAFTRGILDALDPKKLFIFQIDDAENLPRDQLTDAHRLLPGLGILPLKEIIAAFRRIGYDANASVEIFRPEYWERDPFELAREAKAAVERAIAS